MCSKLRVTFWILLCTLGTLSARNYFSPYGSTLNWNSLPVCLSHPGQKISVYEYEMMEIGFEMPDVIDNLIERPKPIINPFDPEDISVIAVFTDGRISDTVFGFYYQDYTRDPSTIVLTFGNCPAPRWNEGPTQYKWRVRYSPHQTGNWIATIKIVVGKNRAAVYMIDPLVFNVESSAYTGFLKIGSDNRHFIESHRNRSFFVMGQDIGWPDGPRFRGGPNEKYPALVHGGYMDILDWTKNLGQNGGNTIRVVNVPWSYELEWDTVGVYNLKHAWELDALFATCESNGVKILFCMEHGTYTNPAWQEEHMDWKKHPYNRFLSGVDTPDDFLSDSIARKHYRDKLRYFFARWGYSTSLGIFQLVSEMEHWSYRDGRLEENKGAQRLQLKWHNEMLSYAKSLVRYRPLLTTTSYGAPPRDFSNNIYSSPFVDVVFPRHCYFTERFDNLRRFEEVNGLSIVEPGIHNMFPDKAALFDETGLGMNGADPGDIDATSDITFHNTIWATSFMGTGGSALYWWQWNRNDYREANYPALSQFFMDVNFESVRYTNPYHWEDANRSSRVRIETFYNVSQDKAFCIGWVHNTSYWWGNISQTQKDRGGKSMVIDSRTADDSKINQPTELPAGTTFEVHGLSANTKYTITWFSTRGKGGIEATEEIKTNLFGTAKVKWRSGGADWGYKLALK